MSTLSDVNAAMFRELDRLENVGVENKEALAAEIERARAVKGVADTIIGNGNLMLRAAQAQTTVGEAVRMPKGMLGD